MSSNKPKKAPKGDYAVGYARPPKANQFQPGQSGNPAGRPRGRPSLDELLLEEAARVVKFQAGDKIMHMDRDRALMRKLFDMALNGKVPAIQLVIARLAQAQAALSVKADPEAPLTEEEIAILAMMPKTSGSAVTRTKFWPREDWKSQLRFRPLWRLATSGTLRRGRRGACGREMALDVERVLDGGVNRQELLS